ncbi:fatty acid desaturase family protein [Prosthecomicrobium pneumaticum]|uniref:Fatty acid desaturase n=1 Tax=Prosthecomicrobium pneumaticum TaxID=81895 RepID=A0A7W9CUJ8_9HYPH|nr:fatty acid desaturase family protein [Prosthecomicrobium pneumaticum]MBB5751818.1 fatty acid desaturase [Prosthecomicrobium pneumaticum]
MPTEIRRDYSLTGPEADRAVARGLATADWYQCPIPRKEMKALMARSDGPALRDTAIWFAALFLSGLGGWYFWGTWWCVPFFAVYGILYGSSSDSRWHECGHGTAFKTPWMNEVVYQIACFMILREPTVWRWSHTRHHTDTIIVGRDPEIAAPRPPDIAGILLNVFALKSSWVALKKIALHATGRLYPDEALYIPESERGKVFRVARIYLVILIAVAAWCLAIGSILPAMFIGLPTLYGAAFVVVFGLTQHAGLDEDVLDHRLNSRTVYMNPVFRFLYWNMNYHVEHHMFPMVPYHQLPKLHARIKDDCPTPYSGLWEAYREIIPALWRQRKDPRFFVRRRLPGHARPLGAPPAGAVPAE